MSQLQNHPIWFPKRVLQLALILQSGNRLRYINTSRFILFFFCIGFFSQLAARQKPSTFDTTLDELRLEISDIKHELHSARVEINLLEEKVLKQERIISASKQNEKCVNNSTDSLEKKVVQMEKMLAKVVDDLRSLSTHTNKALLKMQDLELSVNTQDKKYDEIAKLKGTLSSISKAISYKTQNVSNASPKKYLVKPGDSLEKIARIHHMTVESIKQLNQLSSDKIIIGQELKLLNDEN